MTNPTFPVAAQPGRTLKWAADGSETLINSEYDPDLVAAGAAQSASQSGLSAAAAVEAAVSAKSAACIAATKAAESLGSANQAATSAALATTKAAEAACSVTAVTTVVDEAVTAAAAAAQSAAQAEGAAAPAGSSASSAAGSAASAATAATEASAAATQASGLAAAASGSATTATTAATQAATSAASASGSATAATTAASDAAGSATLATTAAAQATTAAVSASAAASAAADSAQAAALNFGTSLQKAMNLADLPDPAAARDNLGVYAKDETDAAIAAAGISQALLDRLGFLETNLAVTVLRSQIDTGWSVLKMVDGVSDEFEDQTGIASLGGATYDAANDYIHNPGASGGYSQEQTSRVSGWGGGDGPNFGQSFQVQTTEAISKVKFWDHAGFSGTWDVRIETNSGSAPSGTLVASTAKKDDVTGAGTGGWIEVTLDAPFTPTPGTTYWLRLNIASGMPYWGVSNTNTYAYGNAWTSSFGPNSAWVFAFGIYQDVAFPADTTIVSTTTVAAAQPDTARLAILHQPVSAVTLDTDLIAEISRDGGTTWTAAALASAGAFNATTNILTGMADLSAQPAGTAMTWRLRTLNAKEQRIHGVWLQWR
ncbi:MAG: hypothetical protein HY985_15535 [Magnetospirillum sp.]|nr:hypothetical protein [Magnetospirillum sp.]